MHRPSILIAPDCFWICLPSALIQFRFDIAHRSLLCICLAHTFVLKSNSVDKRCHFLDWLKWPVSATIMTIKITTTTSMTTTTHICDANFQFSKWNIDETCGKNYKNVISLIHIKFIYKLFINLLSTNLLQCGFWITAWMCVSVFAYRPCATHKRHHQQIN